MAICIDGNVVCFGGGCFCQTPTGIEFTGEALADCFVDCTPRSPHQGFSHGYVAGGDPTTDNIETFPFAAEGNASDTGELTYSVAYSRGHNSATDGYVTGSNDYIQKFPFATGGPASDVGELGFYRCLHTGLSSSDTSYIAGGKCGGGSLDCIHKFPHATETVSNYSGQLINAKFYMSPHASETHGFVTGGAPAFIDIQKFSFTSESSASDIGDLSVAMYGSAGHSSVTNGYTTGGYPCGGFPGACGSDKIEKFPFASSSNSSDVGEIGKNLFKASSANSIDDGYTMGGRVYPNVSYREVRKFPFASDASASCVGCLAGFNQHRADNMAC